MARAQRSVPQPPGPAALRVPRAEAEEKIQAQIDEGEALLAAQPQSKPDLDGLKEKYRIWDDFNEELLRSLFTTDAVAQEYSESIGGVFRMNPSFGDLIGYYQKDVQNSLTRLRSILRRLPLFAEPAGSAASTPRESSRSAKGDGVFLVHGHNNEVKETVARFLERLGLAVTILHEQPDKGRTIIEKFTDHASVGYAVVLLTGDDVGAPRNSAGDLKPRARQNAVLELGYFLGTLGRTHVCALREDGVEVPSDLSGVLYVPLDAGGAWRLRLATEIKAAGIAVDLNRVM